MAPRGMCVAPRGLHSARGHSGGPPHTAAATARSPHRHASHHPSTHPHSLSMRVPPPPAPRRVGSPSRVSPCCAPAPLSPLALCADAPHPTQSKPVHHQAVRAVVVVVRKVRSVPSLSPFLSLSASPSVAPAPAHLARNDQRHSGRMRHAGAVTGRHTPVFELSWSHQPRCAATSARALPQGRWWTCAPPPAAPWTLRYGALRVPCDGSGQAPAFCMREVLCVHPPTTRLVCRCRSLPPLSFRFKQRRQAQPLYSL